MRCRCFWPFLTIAISAIFLVNHQERFFFDVGIANLSLVGYLFVNWHHQSLTITVLPVIGIIVAFLMPESIFYLYGSGKFKQGKLELESLIKRTNGDLTKLDELSAKLADISSTGRFEHIKMF